jgi:hypothetical protein
MIVNVDICLRGQDFARTESIEGVAREPGGWTDEDVKVVLEGMLRAMHRLKNPGEADPPHVALRGLSWIVNPYDDGGVVIAIEITMGAAVAGPFDIDKAALEGMIARVLSRPAGPSSSAIH